MRRKDFSQLPVMRNERDVLGMITWKSIGERVSVSGSGQLVSECMDPCIKEDRIININDPLLDATEKIANSYVLVRGEGGVITGIVTASDFAVQFGQLAEPFLVIEEIERHLRRLISGKFSDREMKKTVYKKYRKNVRGPDNLTLGAFSRLLEPSEHWDRLGLDTCHESFLERLESVRKIRNSVMHFDPCGLAPERLSDLYDFAVFFRDME